MSYLETKAAKLLGPRPGANLQDWLGIALSEIEDLRSRLHRYNITPTVEARRRWEQGEATLEEVAQSLGISTKAVKVRWAVLNLTRKRGAVTKAVGVLIRKNRYLSDKQMAECISKDGIKCSPEAVASARRKMGVPNVKTRRQEAEMAEVKKYVEEFPWMSADSIRAGMKADGWPWRLPVSRVAACLNELGH